VVLLAFWLLANVQPETVNGIKSAARMSGSLTAFFALCVAFRKPLAERLPPVEVLDDVMYKAIAVGFAFFTIATILGALWAAEAWGGYWSWDPKETWALIVWLNYAAWLHMRLMKGLRGAVAAWWALVGLLVTTFAFLGVNMFLSGLHSYGQL
jgi:cytochrome c-type biogenesis protein CcsB